jgi:hypothetical protein
LQGVAPLWENRKVILDIRSAALPSYLLIVYIVGVDDGLKEHLAKKQSAETSDEY